MHDSALHVELLIVLLLVAFAVATAVKWVKVPYSIALVIVGLAIGLCHVLPPVEMTPHLILLVFLPALLFEASWNMRLNSLKENWRPIAILAIFGVLLSTVAVGAVMHYGAGMSLGAAYLFGALISATDPISVLALFKKIGIDHRLTMILEGESIFNDGTAAVLFNLILAVVMSQTVFSPVTSLGNFIMVVTGGAAVGLILGMSASRITSLFDDHLLEITLTTILAYGSFLIAEQMKVSPVIAVVVAGIVMGNYGSHAGMSPTTRLAVNSFWEYAAFIVNSLVFLLIGLQVKLDLLIQYAPQIGMGILSIILARIPVVFGLCPLVSTDHKPIPWTWQTLLYWGSLRGALCMALALSLPFSFSHREEFIITTFGVVLFTLLVQGLTIEPLVKLLNIRQEDPKLKEYESLKSGLIAEAEALRSLKDLFRSAHISKATFEELEREIKAHQLALKNRIESLHMEHASVQKIEMDKTKLHLTEIRKDTINELIREGIVGEEVAHALKVEIDARLHQLREQEEEPAPEHQPERDLEMGQDLDLTPHTPEKSRKKTDEKDAPKKSKEGKHPPKPDPTQEIAEPY